MKLPGGGVARESFTNRQRHVVQREGPRHALSLGVYGDVICMPSHPFAAVPQFSGTIGPRRAQRPREA